MSNFNKLGRNRPSGHNNVALLGMPSAGKSTLGVMLAKRTVRDFLDTDLLIQDAEGLPLRDLIRLRGADGFRKIEEHCVVDLDLSGTVIATGGSVVYSDTAMKHLGHMAVRVYLSLPLDELQQRIGDLDMRGVVRSPGQTLAEILAERTPLYERYADVRVDCQGLGYEAAVDAVADALARYG